jgi:hypothetical protein
MNCAVRGSYEPDCDLLMFRTAQTSLTRSKRVSGSEVLCEASRSWLGFTVRVASSYSVFYTADHVQDTAPIVAADSNAEVTSVRDVLLRCILQDLPPK